MTPKPKILPNLAERTAPLFDDDLESLLAPYRFFKGVVMSDEVHGLLRDMEKNREKKAGFVMNLEKSNQGGSHWVAIYIDIEPQGKCEIDYYDSFGRAPQPEILAMLSKFARRSYPIKVQHNEEQHQARKSRRCGYHVARFLIGMFKTQDFTRVTNVGSVRQAENRARYMEKMFQTQGFF